MRNGMEEYMSEEKEGGEEEKGREEICKMCVWSSR